MFQHLCVSVVAASLAAAADQPKKGEVAVAAVDTEQPAGWPVVVEIKLTNTGTEPIAWWCGGPDTYPGAEHFAVQVRYGSGPWQDVEATNGQYNQGSGAARPLKPGESVNVPLAVPVMKADFIAVRVRPRRWHAAEPAEAFVYIRDEPRVLDPYRARVIVSVIQPSPPFRRHLAERYADPVVIDALTKLVTVDNQTIVAGAARVLARQPELAPAAGDALAGAVRRWLPRSRQPGWNGLREYLAEAALKTQREPARKAVLDALQETPDAEVRWIAINALRLSPGDQTWLRRARAAVADAGKARPEDAELARQVKLATEWLDPRIK